MLLLISECQVTVTYFFFFLLMIEVFQACITWVPFLLFFAVSSHGIFVLWYSPANVDIFFFF